MIKIIRLIEFSHFSRKTGLLVCYDKLGCSLMWFSGHDTTLNISKPRDAAKSRGRSFTCFKVRYCSCCEERSIRSKKMKIAGKKNLTRLEGRKITKSLRLIGCRINVGPTPIFWNHSTGWKTNVVNHPPPNMGPPSASTFNLHLRPRSQIQSLVGAWSRSRM